MGAIKSLYAVAHEPQLAPACVVAVSPPHLAYSWFCENEERDRFLDHFRAAEQLVDSGRGAELLEVTLPLPMLISAAGFADKYGPAEKYDYLSFIAAVPCPILLMLGEKEVERNVAFRGAPARLAPLAEKRPNLAWQIVAGADHFYSGVRESAWNCLESWLGRHFSSASLEKMG
jgi:hypothetical protein